MKGKGILAVVLVLVGLGLGATLLRDQVPVGGAQQGTGSSAPVQAEAGMRLQNEQNTIDVVSRYEPGLVFISTEQRVVQDDPFGWMFGGEAQTQVQRGVGSGFFVNEAGDILTNYHVVASADGQGAAPTIQIRLMGREENTPAKVIGQAPQYDLALLRAEKLPKELVKPIPLGDSDRLKVGQKAIAMGAPFGLEFSVTEGIVSSISRQIPIGFSGTGTGEGITQKAIQTDAAINPGNSGGPLLDSGGRVIGINTQIYSPSGQASGTAQSAGVGFAIPINAARNLLPRLQAAAGGIVLAPRLGIQPGLVVQGRQGSMAIGLGMLTGQAKQDLGLPDRGLVLSGVEAGSPAAKAGLQGGSRAQQFPRGAISLGGDIIVGVNGKPVDGLEDLQAALIDRKPGDTVALKVWRQGKEREVQVTLDASAFN